MTRNTITIPSCPTLADVQAMVDDLTTDPQGLDLEEVAHHEHMAARVRFVAHVRSNTRAGICRAWELADALGQGQSAPGSYAAWRAAQA